MTNKSLDVPPSLELSGEVLGADWANSPAAVIKLNVMQIRFATKFPFSVEAHRGELAAVQGSRSVRLQLQGKGDFMSGRIKKA